jgi:hypothetical protein
MAPCPVTQGITVPSDSARTKPLPLLRYFGRSIPLVALITIVAEDPIAVRVIVSRRPDARARVKMRGGIVRRWIKRPRVIRSGMVVGCHRRRRSGRRGNPWPSPDARDLGTSFHERDHCAHPPTDQHHPDDQAPTREASRPAWCATLRDGSHVAPSLGRRPITERRPLLFLRQCHDNLTPSNRSVYYPRMSGKPSRILENHISAYALA